MNIFSGILVYVLVWWIVIFCVLPFSIQSIEKPRNGNMPGAPVNPQIRNKMILTTIISVVVWFLIYAVIKSNLVSFHDIAQHMDM